MALGLPNGIARRKPMVSYQGKTDRKFRAAAAARTVIPAEAFEPNPVIFDAEGHGFQLRTNPYVAPVDEK